MTADMLAGIITSLAAFIVPISGGWAWRTENRLTILATKDQSEEEWKKELLQRLARIEDKVDEVRYKK